MKKYTRSRFATFHLERLEDRSVPTTVTWLGGAGDNFWYNPGNWDTNQVPGAKDTVNLTEAATSGVDLKLANGQWTDVTVAGVIIETDFSETLDLGPSTLTVTSAFSMTAGTITGAAGAATLEIKNDSNACTVEWTGGRMENINL